ncbi:MAG: M20 family metallopeptidase [Chloroflexota bacterium]
MDMKSLLKQLVEIESPSSDRDAVNRVGARVAEEARRLGAQVETFSNTETGDHVLCRFPSADGRTDGGLLLLCHMDTVFALGTLDKMPYREADGKIFGPGVLDMKAGIVISLAAIQAAQRGGLKHPVTLLCTSDEEIGSPASRALIENLARDMLMTFVLEGGMPDGALKIWRKGGGGFKVYVKGRAAHAGGDHQNGRNAIEEMAHQVLAIQKLTDYSRGTTVSVGIIQGGTVSNVVPDEAFIEVDARILLPEEWDRLDAAMHSLQPALDGTSIRVTSHLNRGPMPADERMQANFAKVQAIAAGIGMQVRSGGTGGVSDANFVAALGLSVIDGMGAVGEGYHSEREFIHAGSLEERASLLAALLQNW